jgi:DNA-binding Lrp family transcriptional regulator
MDEIDRKLVNRLQDGIPVEPHPYAGIAAELGLPVSELLARVQQLLDDRVLTRFGPMFNAENMGGALSLCAMQVPEADFEQIAEQVNAYPEVAHNYARNHHLNMWFVVATEQPEQAGAVIASIERNTGCKVYDMHKLEEFYIGLKFAV